MATKAFQAYWWQYVNFESPINQGEVEAYILVNSVTSRAVGIVETLNDFWSKRVAAAGDVEACTLVEFCLVCWDVGFVPAECFGADAC